MDQFENFIPALIFCITAWTIIGLIIWLIKYLVDRRTKPPIEGATDMHILTKKPCGAVTEDSKPCDYTNYYNCGNCDFAPRSPIGYN